MPSRTFIAVIERDARGRTIIPLPFDPAEAWGPRARYHITGTVGGRRVRGPLTGEGAAARLVLGPSWCRDAGLEDGGSVEVVLEPSVHYRLGEARRSQQIVLRGQARIAEGARVRWKLSAARVDAVAAAA